MTALNVFQIGSGWFPELKGGAENIFYNIYRGLDKEGFAVRGVVPGSDSIEQQTEGQIQSFPTKASSLPRRAADIRRMARNSFRRDRPDVVACHFALYGLPVLDKFSTIPLVSHFHGPWALESRVEGSGRTSIWAKKAIENLVYRRAQRVIVLSHAFEQILRDHYGVRPDRIRFVPGGVDCDRFDTSLQRAEARRALGWDDDCLTVFAVRRLVKRMGLSRLIDAMAILARASTPGARDVVLRIAGTGPELEALTAHAADLGLSEVVRFEGFMPDDRLTLAYRAADVTLMPTASLEGFGLVAAESLASGTPVLVTPVGGLTEVVAGLSEAMVLESTDAESIARGIGAFAADGGMMPDADACRRHARRNFDWNVILPQIGAVYREVLS